MRASRETSDVRRAQPAPRVPARRARDARGRARARGRGARRGRDAREPRRARNRRVGRGADRRRPRHRIGTSLCRTRCATKRERLGLATTDIADFPSVVFVGDKSRLSDVRAADAGFPLRGVLFRARRERCRTDGAHARRRERSTSIMKCWSRSASRSARTCRSAVAILRSPATSCARRTAATCSGSRRASS